MTSSDFATQRRNKVEKKNYRRFVVFIFFLGVIFFLVRIFYQNISLSSNKGNVTSVLLDADVKENTSLAAIVRGDLQNTTGSYGVYIKNLKTDEGFVLNDHRVFDSASLYKLWVMATVFEQIEGGSLHEDDELEEDVSVLNEKFQIASESAEQTEGTVDLTVSDALSQMITISDNYAALLLTEKIRLSSVATFLSTHGFLESEVGVNGDNPTTTASDVGLFFEKLYRGELADTSQTDAMLTLLKQQKLNEKLPKYLPDGTAVAHKTGELDTFSHDAGIVYTPRGNYIIVVLSDSDDPPSAVERIAIISRDVYTYFTTKK